MYLDKVRFEKLAILANGNEVGLLSLYEEKYLARREEKEPAYEKFSLWSASFEGWEKDCYYAEPLDSQQEEYYRGIYVPLAE